MKQETTKTTSKVLPKNPFTLDVYEEIYGKTLSNDITTIKEKWYTNQNHVTKQLLKPYVL